MSRNFVPEETLVDQLLLDDTAAFEELHRRYWFSLYSYSLNKLNSPEDAKRVVRDIFIALWEGRHSLPVGFSISFHLYTEVRKSVVKIINERLLDEQGALDVEKRVIPGFALNQLKKAKQPVAFPVYNRNRQHAPTITHSASENFWWKYAPAAFNIKGLRHAFQNILNFW